MNKITPKTAPKSNFIAYICNKNPHPFTKTTMIYTKQLISDLRNAFGENLKLPYAIWYSITPQGEEVALPHCMFDAMPMLEQGTVVTFSKEKLHCGGGRIYGGYNP